MDHVRTGKWASVLPRPVRIMASDDPELEAIPLPNIGKASSVAIAISKREPVSPLAEAFFELARSEETSLRLRAALGVASDGPGGQRSAGITDYWLNSNAVAAGVETATPVPEDCTSPLTA